MKAIFGSSGFAKEVNFLLTDTYYLDVDCFVSKDHIGSDVQGKGVISEEEFYDRVMAGLAKDVEIYIGIGSPLIRKKIVDKINVFQPNILFPNAIYKDVVFDKNHGRIVFGVGNIICAGVKLTTDITIGDHNHINLNSTIGHDAIIGSYNTFSPGVHISGNVQVGNYNFIGTGATVLEKVKMGDNIIIGAGCVVTKDLIESGTYVGIPAKKIK